MAADSGTYDQATLLRRQKIADAMLADSRKAKPITHWAEGLAQLADAGVAGHFSNKVDQEAKASRAADMAALMTLLGGSSSPAPSAPAETSGQLLPAPKPNTAPGKIYSNDEPSPLDPPSGQDRTRMIATILGESANQPAAGQNAVASVIRNRAVAGNYGGDTPSGVVTARNQFEPWNTAGGRDKMAAMAADPRLAAKADQAIALAYGEGGRAPNDPTNGAMNFIEPKLQTALGRPMPDWAKAPGVMIGDHKFIGGAPQAQPAPYDVAGPPTAPPQTPVAQAMTPPQMPAGQPQGGLLAKATPQQRAAIIAGMGANEGSPARAIATSMMSELVKGDKPTDDIREFEYGLKNPAFAARQEALKAAGRTQINNNVGGGSDKQIFDAMDESAKAARTTAAGLTGLREARAAIEGGAITGFRADNRLSLQKAGALFGIADPGKIVNTETFKAAIAPQVAAVLKSTVGTANISNTDREFAEKAAGGNIELDEKSISRLLDIMERASVGQLEAHQKRIDKVYADPEKFGRERALFGVDMPAVPARAAPAAPAPKVDLKKKYGLD